MDDNDPREASTLTAARRPMSIRPSESLDSLGVNQATSFLDAQLGTLQESLGVLEDRLVSVLRSVAERDGLALGIPVSDESSGLAQQIASDGHRVGQAVERVQSLLQRLDL